MRKHLIRNKKARYATVTLLLTVMVIVVTLLCNAVFSSLAERYLWYANLNEEETYEVTEDCYALLQNAFDNAKSITGKDASVRLIFCDLKENLMAEDTTRFLYTTATDLAARFEEIRIENYDIITDPTKVKAYTSTLDPVTGETITTGLVNSSVIVVTEGYHRVYELADFYVFADESSPDSLWAYKGERKLASAILRAVDPEEHIVCLTNNHGETFSDYELLYLLDDAGYTIVYMDLYKEPIPENCEMIISYNPSTDLVADGVSALSELVILDSFLATEGHSFLVFLDSGTPQLPNFERYLKAWGISTAYSQPNAAGVSHRYMIRDTERSLTSDGYTIFADAATNSVAEQIADRMNKQVIFKSATGLQIAQEGYKDNRDGSFSSFDGKRTVYPLYQSGNTSLAWANGKVVDDGNVMMMSLTEQTNAKGASYVGVIGSVDFSSGDFLQSAVYGNSDALMNLCVKTGREITPAGLTIKPFASTDISMITTAQMLRWTLALTLIPAVAITVVAAWVLIKRRRA